MFAATRVPDLTYVNADAVLGPIVVAPVTSTPMATPPAASLKFSEAVNSTSADPDGPILAETVGPTWARSPNDALVIASTLNSDAVLMNAASADSAEAAAGLFGTATRPTTPPVDLTPPPPPRPPGPYVAAPPTPSTGRSVNTAPPTLTVFCRVTRSQVRVVPCRYVIGCDGPGGLAVCRSVRSSGRNPTVASRADGAGTNPLSGARAGLDSP